MKMIENLQRVGGNSFSASIERDFPKFEFLLQKKRKSFLLHTEHFSFYSIIYLFNICWKTQDERMDEELVDMLL